MASISTQVRSLGDENSQLWSLFMESVEERFPFRGDVRFMQRDDGKWVAQREPCETPTQEYTILSPDERYRASIVRHGKKWVVEHNGAAQNDFDDLEPDSLQFSPNGRRLAYVAQKRRGFFSRSESYAVVDGQELGPYRIVQSLQFSPDSGRVAFLARTFDSNEWLVVIDGEWLGPYRKARLLQFSPDSRQVAFVAKMSFFCGDLELKFGAQVAGFAFSPDGELIAFWTEPSYPGTPISPATTPAIDVVERSCQKIHNIEHTLYWLLEVGWIDSNVLSVVGGRPGERTLSDWWEDFKSGTVSELHELKQFVISIG